jgi:hypothetical protein
MLGVALGYQRLAEFVGAGTTVVGSSVQRTERHNGGQDLLEQTARMTSAIWNVKDRLWRTIFAPIFTNLSRSVVMDLFYLDGQLGVRRKLARV